MLHRALSISHAAFRLAGAPAMVVALAPVPLAGGEVPVEEAAKFLLILATSAGSEGRVACRELDMVIQLKKQAISVDAKAHVAWAFTAEQTKFYAAESKLVVCNHRKLLEAGGAIAFERIHGRLTIFVHPANLGRSGVKLPESFLRGAVKV